MDKEQLEAIYQSEGYYWGEEHNEMAKNLVKIVAVQTGQKIVWEQGEGRDSVFFAGMLSRLILR